LKQLYRRFGYAGRVWRNRDW